MPFPSTDYTTAADALMPSLLTYLPQTLHGLLMVPFDYSAIFPSTVLTAGSAPNVTTAIQSDSHFALLATNSIVLTTATPPLVVTGGTLLVRFQDQGSGMYLDDALQPLNCRAGSSGGGGLPGYWAGIGVPYLLVANTGFNTQLSNLDTTAAFSAWLVHRGVKIFGVPRNQTPPPGQT